MVRTFVDPTKKLDEVRDLNILDIVPQYKDLFNAHNYENLDCAIITLFIHNVAIIL